MKIVKANRVSKSVLFLFIISLPLLSLSCSEESLQSKQLRLVEWKFKKEGASLSQSAALYALAYTHHKEGGFFSREDFYVRRDVVTISYGYDVSQVSIQIEGNKLKVRLPEPTEQARDRKIKDIKATSDYTPKDENGKPIDIDKVMDSELTEVILKNRDKSIGVSRELSVNYFQSLAKLMGLEADVVFEGKSSSSDDKQG